MKWIILAGCAASMAFAAETSVHGFGSGSTVYGVNYRNGINRVYTSNTSDFVADYDEFGPPSTSFQGFAIDMDLDATTLYAIVWDGNNSCCYGRYDLTDGTFAHDGVVAGVPADANISGLSIDPTTGTWYIVVITGGTEVSTLYSGDIETGTFAPVGDIGFDVIIDIAIDSQGNAYGHDIFGDQLIAIDLATGAGTVIGPTGQPAIFAQGMDFDYADDTLYATIYRGNGSGRFVSFDLTTGFANVIESTTPLNIEAEIVIANPLSRGEPCPADFDGDGEVEFDDFTHLLAEFGSTCPCETDLDNDGDVDFDDFTLLLASFGPCP